MNNKDLDLIKNDWCISIMTYSKRLNYLTTLIENIRSQDKDIIIYLAINGDYNVDDPFNSIYNEEYRRNILKLALSYNNIYIRHYAMFRSCAYIHNDLVCNCGKENVIISNDDVLFKDGFLIDFKDFINNLDDKSKYLVRVNGSFSTHFLTRNFLIDNNFYNEKFLGIGCEDCEFTERNCLFTKNTILSFKTDKHDNYAGHTITELSNQGAVTDGTSCNKYHTHTQEVSYRESRITGYVYENPRPVEKYFIETYCKFWKNT